MRPLTLVVVASAGVCAQWAPKVDPKIVPSQGMLIAELKSAPESVAKEIV
jgi:hypothetical protein